MCLPFPGWVCPSLPGRFWSPVWACRPGSWASFVEGTPSLSSLALPVLSLGDWEGMPTGVEAERRSSPAEVRLSSLLACDPSFSISHCIHSYTHRHARTVETVQQRQQTAAAAAAAAAAAKSLCVVGCALTKCA